LPRKTDANNPADWAWMAASDLEVIAAAAVKQVGFTACRSKLAEVVEKAMKGELASQICKELFASRVVQS